MCDLRYPHASEGRLHIVSIRARLDLRFPPPASDLLFRFLALFHGG